MKPARPLNPPLRRIEGRFGGRLPARDLLESRPQPVEVLGRFSSFHCILIADALRPLRNFLSPGAYSVFNPRSQRMPKPIDIHGVLVVGQACEFDQTGTGLACIAGLGTGKRPEYEMP